MSTNETAVAIRMADLSPEHAEIMVLGNVLQKSGYFKDVRDQAQAVTKILFGRELGFSPIVSMGGIHIIEGKPALSSNLMATLIKRSGKYDYRVKIWTDDTCSLMFREKSEGKWEEVGSSVFTMDDAKKAGVVKPNGSWSKYPKAMLFARALSQGLRTYCPDVSAAPIYNPEEMGATVNEEGEVTELPKSARPVERTTEEIKIEPPKKIFRPPFPEVTGFEQDLANSPSRNPAQDSLQEGVVGRESQGGEPLSTPAVKTAEGGHDGVPRVTSAAPSAADVGKPLPAVTTDVIGEARSALLAVNEYITSDDAAAIYMACKKYKPKDMKEATLRSLVHDWAKSHGLVDLKGDGTLLKVKKVYVVDGKAISGITRTREALEHYMMDLLAEKSQSK